MKIHRSSRGDYINFLYKREAIAFRPPQPQAASGPSKAQKPRGIDMREYSIAAIPADGIGPEVIAAGVTALENLQKRLGDVRFNVETFDWGSAYYRKHGVMMPADGLAMLKKFDAIYFGAVGAPDVPDHITLWGLRLPICQGFDQYANVRPTRILPTG
jgi:tartrate dehydrogenase/decarboxylase/D-malate dehydrogenase